MKYRLQNKITDRDYNYIHYNHEIQIIEQDY